MQDCYPRHPLTPPCLALALATAPSRYTEPMPEPGQLWSGAPTPHSPGHRACRRAGGGVFGILFPGMSQVSRPSMSVPNVWSKHPPTNLPVDLGSWRAVEPRSQVRWWLAQGLVWFKASLGCISLISQHFVILRSLGGPGILHWGVSPCGFPVCIRALNSGWMSNLIRVAHSFQCAETAACLVQCDT